MCAAVPVSLFQDAGGAYAEHTCIGERRTNLLEYVVPEARIKRLRAGQWQTLYLTGRLHPGLVSFCWKVGEEELWLWVSAPAGSSFPSVKGSVYQACR